jgi:hypothetical protein
MYVEDAKATGKEQLAAFLPERSRSRKTLAEDRPV